MSSRIAYVARWATSAFCSTSASPTPVVFSALARRPWSSSAASSSSSSSSPNISDNTTNIHLTLDLELVLAARARAFEHYDGPPSTGWRRILARPDDAHDRSQMAMLDLSRGNVLANREDYWRIRYALDQRRWGRGKPKKGEGKRTKKRK